MCRTASSAAAPAPYVVDTIATGLRNPWSLAFLPDFYALMQAEVMFRAPSTFGLWAGILGNQKRVFSPDLRGKPWQGEGRPKQDVPFVEGNHMPLTSHWVGHSELHLRET